MRGDGRSYIINDNLLSIVIVKLSGYVCVCVFVWVLSHMVVLLTYLFLYSKDCQRSLEFILTNVQKIQMSFLYLKT